MQPLSSLDLLTAQAAAASLTTADYVRLLHPTGAWGKATVVIIPHSHGAISRTSELEQLPWVAETVLDEQAYLALNRYHGPRGGNRLATLNALYLDLDFWRLSQWQGHSQSHMAMVLEFSLARQRIPQPSFVMDTGRGLAAVWLIEDLPAAAEPRWRACMRTLINLHGEMGADTACSDAARIFGIPGSVNRKSGRLVRILGGTLQRYPFDPLADTIWRAAGRPTRHELERRRERKDERLRNAHAPTRPRGLPARQRFAQVLRDLERLRLHWGGEVPEGLRNIWLHLYATALTHTAEPSEIASSVEVMAAQGTPGLAPSEVRSLVAGALKRAEQARSPVPAQDGRYHYSGARMAELLGVGDEMARDLRLEQVFSRGERARRKAARETASRAAQGAVSRMAYLSVHDVSRTKPWLADGVSRATWYRRQRVVAERNLVLGDPGMPTVA